jgi:ubiquinone/menaquinone biosynthesis C-methylase UbiE
METQDAYNRWAKTYDSVVNKTRDLEAIAIRSVLANAHFGQVLEIGCGTGKNTAWLAETSDHLTAVDFSEAMLKEAKEKIHADHIHFQQGDITKPWTFGKADLITCSLVLEHIEDIGFVFQQVAATLQAGGQFYLCEFHPYKQLQGSGARFELEGTTRQLEYFIHQVSDFFDAARKNSLTCDQLQEWFDDEDRSQTPRLISFLFHKN